MNDFHPGAIRYFRGKGITVPKHLMPPLAEEEYSGNKRLLCRYISGSACATAQ